VEKLLVAKIPVETQKHTDGIMHIKTIVTEKAYASGSYNWTESATSHNDEILEIGYNKYLHDKYLAIIEKLLITNQ
jgi:phosphatidylserine/phosphatidylglycerophosphate/cardiolipin synthase-like enzyme